MKKLLVLTVSVFLFLGCKDTTVSTFVEKEFSMRTLVKDVDGGSYTGNHVFKNDLAYENFYGQVTNGFLFGNEMIVVVYKGVLSVGGNRYEIVRVLEKENEIEVFVEFEPCKQTCPTVVTRPYHMIATDFSSKTVIFTEIEI